MRHGGLSFGRTEGGGRLQLHTVLLSAFPAAVLWMLLVGTPSRHELEVGAFAVALSCAALFVLHRSYPESVRIGWRDLLPLRHVPGSVLRDTVSVTRVLLLDLVGKAPVPSLYRTVRWEQLSDKVLERGRGVLATVAMTASPNTIVIGIDPEQSLMVLHQVSREPLGKAAVELGAKP